MITIKKSLCIKKSSAQGWVVDKSTETLLSDLEGSYEEPPNPVYVLQAFLLCRQRGENPPEWVMRWIEKGFKEYSESYGREDLDALLGFTEGKGKDPAFKRDLIEHRNDTLLTDIALLRGIFDLSLDQAAYMVERRLEETPESEFNKSEWPIGRPKARRLRDLYARDPIYKGTEKDIQKTFGDRWTEKDKREYLKQYPDDSFPEELKAYLKRFK